MDITNLQVEGYERVARAHDPQSGLRAIIAVHNTVLGPALGGMRMWSYASEEEALTDVLRLSKGMTYKSAVAKTGLGGGKAVIIGDPLEIKTEALFLAMGRFIDAFEGSYITAEDVNIKVADLEIVRRATKHVTGLSRKDGGSGNPSPYTAYGVYLGIRAALGWKCGDDNVMRHSIAVQGVGAVGSEVCRLLRKEGATVYVSDRKEDRVRALVDEIGVEAVAGDEILSLDVDVLSPCALGAVIDDETIEKLRCKIIAGSANNVLLEPRHGRDLRDRKVLYAPDYVINAGGIINVAAEFISGGYQEDEAIRRIERIPQALKEVWTIAEEDGISASDAADHLAQRILESRV